MNNQRAVIGLTSSGLLLAAGLVSEAAMAADAPAAPEVPAPLRVPAEAKLLTKLHAEGAQVYGCGATEGKSGKTFGWTLKRPDATLTDATGAAAGKHGAGPSWTAKDGSTVNGAKVAAADAPAADAVPWLLLRATSTSGKGRFTDVSFIQRLATKGGKAPATGCDAAHDGAELRVGYSADYYFFSGGAPAPAPANAPAKK
jgi:Protein of unknown function (DUF3455)